MHAGRCAELADLMRPSRIAHVVHGETLRAVEARATDGADIGVTLVHLHQTAAAPGSRSVVTEQAKILGFFGIGGWHDSSLLIHKLFIVSQASWRDRSS